MTETVTIELSEADAAALREWAANREISLETLLQEAIAAYMDRTRAWIEDIEEAEKGPFSPIEEVEARLAERRSRYRDQTAE